jgi:hypothetical protein
MPILHKLSAGGAEKPAPLSAAVRAEMAQVLYDLLPERALIPFPA